MCATQVQTSNSATCELSFPPFDLQRLLRTVFDPSPGQRIAILIDLDDLTLMRDFAFLGRDDHPIQRRAVEHFHRPLNESVLADMGLEGGEIFAYQRTGGSNLEIPESAVTPTGETVNLENDVYAKYDILLCISTESATAPLAAHAKRIGFRGATLHGINDVILNSGLCVDYAEVSAAAEKMRAGMTRADWVEIDFQVLGRDATLRLDLGQQEAQKSHGLCLGDAPDVANLPAGEVYFVPTGADGVFPLKYEDGTIALLTVQDGAVRDAELLSGEQATVDRYMNVIAADPAAGRIGELGFGTQVLPRAGVDIQDEKILGTVHVATGRSDHLGGDIVLDSFEDARNASHDDILFDPEKTPEIAVPEVRMRRNGETVVLLANYEPAGYVAGMLSAE